MKKIILSVLVLACACTSAWSQAMLYSKIDQDPTSAAMGGASVAGRASYAWTSHYSPAMMAFAESKGDVSLSYQNWAPTASNYINLGGFYTLGDKLGLSAGAVYGTGEAIPNIDESGKQKGTFSPSDLMAGLAASYKINDVFSAGASVSYLSQDIYFKYSYNVISSNISVAAAVSDFKVTAAVKSLGSQVESASGVKFSQALSIGAGALYAKEVGRTGKVNAALEADFFTAGEFSAALGAAYTYDDMVSVRAGYHLGDKIMPSYASAGLGVSVLGVHFDFAYLFGAKDSTPGGSFVCGLGYSF